ncbi:hypothetical protein Ciccas_014238, partial [Cichlidogyrus casuarinus]
NEAKKLLNQYKNKSIVIDFTATWCGPCQKMAPVFMKYSDNYREMVFLKIDVDCCPVSSCHCYGIHIFQHMAKECGVSVMPTFKFLKNGKIVDEMVGASEDKLRALIAKNK